MSNPSVNGKTDKGSVNHRSRKMSIIKLTFEPMWNWRVYISMKENGLTL